jgi:hypothetical protein
MPYPGSTDSVSNNPEHAPEVSRPTRAFFHGLWCSNLLHVNVNEESCIAISYKSIYHIIFRLLRYSCSWWRNLCYPRPTYSYLALRWSQDNKLWFRAYQPFSPSLLLSRISMLESRAISSSLLGKIETNKIWDMVRLGRFDRKRWGSNDRKYHHDSWPEKLKEAASNRSFLYSIGHSPNWRRRCGNSLWRSLHLHLRNCS